jgi:mycothiol system anti-sigma-R factor
MNCTRCLETLDTYVDRELTDAELDEVKRHLADCPPCDDRYALKVHMKRLVKVCCDQGRAPAHLRSKLRQILF